MPERPSLINALDGGSSCGSSHEAISLVRPLDRAPGCPRLAVITRPGVLGAFSIEEVRMGLRDRLQRFLDGQTQARKGGTDTPTTPTLFPQMRYGIVDGEIVEVHGQGDIPGMSPVLWVSGINDGVYTPVPITDCQQFSTASQALLAQRQGHPSQR
jgi:hypothetical protein